MIKFLSAAKIDSSKKACLLRLDLNIIDGWRLKRSLPTIKWLLRGKKKIIILSHKGRPKGVEKYLSLRGEAGRLEKLLRKKIYFFNHFKFSDIKATIKKSLPGSIFLLENLRFLPGEQKNSLKLAKQLSGLGDFYVNDAFAVCHRADTSVAAITKFLPSFAGLDLEKEIENLSQAVKNSPPPYLVILGGSKISTKLPVFNHLKSKADIFLIGGALANNLLLAAGYEVGKSMTEKEMLKESKKIIKNKKIILPKDVVVNDSRKKINKDIDKIKKDEIILDIGPKTVELFSEKIQKARMIVWNGPMGKFEEKGFEKGTKEIAKAVLNNKKAKIIIGGGETIASLRIMNHESRIKNNTFISTGGGAMLEFLAGRKLAGLEALK